MPKIIECFEKKPKNIKIIEKANQTDVLFLDENNKAIPLKINANDVPLEYIENFCDFMGITFFEADYGFTNKHKLVIYG